MKDKIKNVGKRAFVALGKFKVEVEIKDYKRSYGQDRWLVSPVAGSGEAWVENVTKIHAVQ